MKGWVIVLAAGSARRFGRSKARLPWGAADEPLLARAVRVSLAARHVEGVIVVVSGADPSLGALLGEWEPRRVDIVVNMHAHEGMASSIRVGVDRADDRGAAFVVLLAVDQPFVEAEDIGALAEAIVAGAPAAAAAYAGVVGIPAAFARGGFDALRALEGDRGARRLLRDEPIDGLLRLPMPRAETDLDTEEAYLAARGPGGDSAAEEAKEG